MILSFSRTLSLMSLHCSTSLAAVTTSPSSPLVLSLSSLLCGRGQQNACKSQPHRGFVPYLLKSAMKAGAVTSIFIFCLGVRSPATCRHIASYVSCATMADDGKHASQLGPLLGQDTHQRIAGMLLGEGQRHVRKHIRRTLLEDDVAKEGRAVAAVLQASRSKLMLQTSKPSDCPSQSSSR